MGMKGSGSDGHTWAVASLVCVVATRAGTPKYLTTAQTPYGMIGNPGPPAPPPSYTGPLPGPVLLQPPQAPGSGAGTAPPLDPGPVLARDPPAPPLPGRRLYLGCRHAAHLRARPPASHTPQVVRARLPGPDKPPAPTLQMHTAPVRRGGGGGSWLCVCKVGHAGMPRPEGVCMVEVCL